MAGDRILLFENPARISVSLGRLAIERPDVEKTYVATADVAVVVFHHHTIEVTVAALRALSEAGAVVMVTDATHLPAALMVPLAANRTAPSRLRLQIGLLSTSIPEALWQSIVSARIATQAATLRAFGLNGALRLERMVKEVEPGDRTHREGQAARHYWQYLFGNFRREREGAKDGINARLNYGYAVLRSLVARELVSAGLSCELGLGHKQAANPFNLADDFTEPYRFIVERHIRKLESAGPLTSSEKREVLGFVESEVRLGSQSYRLLPAVRETVASYVRLLEKNQGQLKLPGG